MEWYNLTLWSAISSQGNITSIRFILNDIPTAIWLENDLPCPLSSILDDRSFASDPAQYGPGMRCLIVEIG